MKRYNILSVVREMLAKRGAALVEHYRCGPWKIELLYLDQENVYRTLTAEVPDDADRPSRPTNLLVDQLLLDRLVIAMKEQLPPPEDEPDEFPQRILCIFCSTNYTARSKEAVQAHTVTCTEHPAGHAIGLLKRVSALTWQDTKNNEQTATLREHVERFLAQMDEAVKVGQEPSSTVQVTTWIRKGNVKQHEFALAYGVDKPAAEPPEGDVK